MSNENSKATSQRPSAVVATLVVSILLFVASLTQDGFYIDRPDDPRAWSLCLGLLLVGWIAVFDGVYAWLANPALLVAWIAMWFRPSYKVAVVAGVTALCFSLSFLRHDTIITSEAPTYSRITGYGLGYWLWIGSIATALAGGVLGICTSRSTT